MDVSVLFLFTFLLLSAFKNLISDTLFIKDKILSADVSRGGLLNYMGCVCAWFISNRFYELIREKAVAWLLMSIRGLYCKQIYFFLQREQQDDSDDSEADSTDDEEETKSKKKKRKHKKKHKKHSKKSKKHKKKSKKKKKKKDDTEDEVEEDETKDEKDEDSTNEVKY